MNWIDRFAVWGNEHIWIAGPLVLVVLAAGVLVPVALFFLIERVT